MARVAELVNPAHLKTPLQRVLAVVLVLAVVAAVAIALLGGRAERNRLDALPDCSGDTRSGCLEVREGQGFNLNRGSSRTPAFQPTGGERENIRISKSADGRRDLNNGEVRGLYEDGDLVGLESAAGTRVYAGGFFTMPGTWLAGLGVALVVVVASGLALAGSLGGARRRS